MESLKQNFLIIDTETTKKGHNMPYQSVFDIGWTITNRKGEILCQRSYIVGEFKYQALTKKRAFLIDENVVDGKIYFTKLLQKKMIVINWQYIIAQLNKDCNKHGVEFVGAYNLGFDMNVINKTHFFLTGKELNFFERYFLVDLYHVSAYTVLNTDMYKKFATENNLISEKGNFKTGAEATFRYLFNKEYVEEHTALQDSEDESKILHYLLDSVDYIPIHAYAINSQSWRIVNEK